MSNAQDVLQVEGINSKGFGIIPKLVMQDRRLTAQAKAIYSYFASYAGAGQTAFPSRAKIVSDLGIGIHTYYRHFDLLRKYGYIKAEQEKGEKGKFKRNLYTLLTDIPLETPCVQNEHTEPCACFPHADEPYADNEHTNNNSLKKQQSLKINSQSSPSEKMDGQDRDIPQEIETYTALIKDNIGYGDFQTCQPHDIRLIDEIVAVMVDALVSDSKYVLIDGEKKPRALVQHQLMKLDYGAIEHVVGQFREHTGLIKKKRQYLLTMLYNCPMEIDAHYTNLVKHDLGY